MNIFIYDAITEKYQKKTRRFEEQINKLNLQGKIIYLKDIKKPQEYIEKEIGSGAKTIVVLGDDKTLNNIINIIANINYNIPLLIVPIGDKNNIANSLGIKNEKEAAFTLSARRVESLNLAKINDLYFLSNCHIKTEKTKITIDNSYNLTFNKKSDFYIFNLLDREIVFKKISPQDNLLNIFVDTNSKDKSFISTNKTIEINNTDNAILVDNFKNIQCPATVLLSEKKISFIVGKERSF